MIQLIYVSNSAQEMQEDDLVFLLEQSRHRNKRLDITGMLLYSKEQFFQVLEGAEKDVKAVYDSIVKDDRNQGNIVIKKSKIHQRLFPEWSMGFKNLDTHDKPSIKGYSEFLTRRMRLEEFANEPDVVIELLFQFKSNSEHI